MFFQLLEVQQLPLGYLPTKLKKEIEVLEKVLNDNKQELEQVIKKY